MKIENNGISPLAPKPADNAHPVDRSNRTSESAGSVANRDRATLSERARSLAKARAALEETSDVRTEKVEQLKEQVESGSYQIPFEDLARKLLNKLGLR